MLVLSCTIVPIPYPAEKEESHVSHPRLFGHQDYIIIFDNISDAVTRKFKNKQTQSQQSKTQVSPKLVWDRYSVFSLRFWLRGLHLIKQTVIYRSQSM